MYSSMKEDTVWSFERLQSYIDEKYAKEKELPENWVYTTFTVSFCISTLLLVFLFGGEGGLTELFLLRRVRICSQTLYGEHFLLFARERRLFCNNSTPHFCIALFLNNRD